MKHLTFFVLVICLTASACKRAETPQAKGEKTVTMQLRSGAFAEGERIPKEFACDGEDKSPPLAWTGTPNGTKSLALICDDPDAPMGTWVHWVLWGLKGNATSLPENLSKAATLPDSVKQGRNSWPRVGYNGPCPPPGKPHRYYFKLYALDVELALSESTDQAALEKAMQGHILAQAQLMGRYGR
jgi:Raf kinase inhibitor-like YbhB/YbcL family protein